MKHLTDLLTDLFRAYRPRVEPEGDGVIVEIDRTPRSWLTADLLALAVNVRLEHRRLLWLPTCGDDKRVTYRLEAASDDIEQAVEIVQAIVTERGA